MDDNQYGNYEPPEAEDLDLPEDMAGMDDNVEEEDGDSSDEGEAEEGIQLGPRPRSLLVMFSLLCFSTTPARFRRL